LRKKRIALLKTVALLPPTWQNQTAFDKKKISGQKKIIERDKFFWLQEMLPLFDR
jgi:hypothetical protein